MNFILEQAGAAGAAQTGALDLGGASTQISFAPGRSIMADSYRATVNQQTTQVYSHSYMNAGQDRSV